jgi:hypothetical protein
MLTLIFIGIIINLLPLYSLSYFVFCSFNYFRVSLCTRVNFVIGLCAVKFAPKQTRIELNWIIVIIIIIIIIIIIMFYSSPRWRFLLYVYIGLCSARK